MGLEWRKFLTSPNFSLMDKVSDLRGRVEALTTQFLIPRIPVSSSLHSAESSLEVSPRRLERLKLDLNRISDDSDAPPSDLRMEGRLHYNRNGHRSPSPASSSSSMQPSLRNIDLNDIPYLQNDFLEQVHYHSKSSQTVSAFIAPKPDDPVISIMGARVEVNRKDFISQAEINFAYPLN
ncbi:hypothetical protein LWI28_002219 [Acer negundo]|uniref:Uncharacterized protein n=1 Tax=Acer negundo TaxID=4023 RepID=A0AAD5NYY3_ACENE|nr:hypothetical protein LWI28_002219 [Acer negundo]